jgi:hypothetical protein
VTGQVALPAGGTAVANGRTALVVVCPVEVVDDDWVVDDDCGGACAHSGAVQKALPVVEISSTCSPGRNWAEHCVAGQSIPDGLLLTASPPLGLTVSVGQGWKVALADRSAVIASEQAAEAGV